jgi:DNA-binding LacI/PurR family transcriptional regulator
VHGGAVAIGPATRADRHPEFDQGDRPLIGLVVPNATYYYADVIRGAEAMAGRYGARLVLGVSGYDNALEQERIEKVLAAGVAGLLLSTAMGDGRAEELGSWLDDVGVPVVLMERAFGFPHVGREYDHVRTDHAYGALLALRHLAALGHRRIGASLRPSVTSFWLRQGIEQAAGMLDIEPFVSAFVLSERNEDDAHLDAFLAECAAHEARAVLVHSDEDAARLVERAMERGMRIPDDLAVIAYDDVTAALAVTPLTAVCPPKVAIGRTACELLVRRLRNTDGPAQPTTHLSLLPELRIRASCGPPL